MDVRYSPHSRQKMALNSISEAEVDSVVSDPVTVEVSRGPTMRYVKVVDRRPIRVVLAHDMDPPYVVTVMLVRFGGPY